MNKYKNKENKHNKSIELCIRDENNLIVAWQVGMSEEDIDKTVNSNFGWKRSHECVDMLEMDK